MRSSLLLCVFAVVSAVSLASAETVLKTPAAAAIESAFPESSASSDAALSYPPQALIPIRGAVLTVTLGLVAQAAAAYKATQPQFQASFVGHPTNGGIKGHFLTDGGFDFAVSTASPTGADYQKMESLGYFPLQANGIVPSYNLPIAVSNNEILALKGSTLCKIFRGAITKWNDPEIVAANPAMALGGAAADRNITILLLSTGSATHLAFSTYCNKIDATFAATITPSTLPNYPTGSFGGLRYYIDIDLMNSAVSDEPYCLTMTTLSNAKQISLPIGAMVNQEGTPILATTNSMSLNLFELATNGFAPGTNSFDLTNPQTPQAWPIMTMSYLYIDLNRALSTCATKKLLLEFFMWFYQSPVVASIASSLNMVTFSAVFVSQIRLLERLQAEVTCQGTSLLQSAETKGFIALNSLAQGPMVMYSSFYLDVDTSLVFQSTTMTEALAVQRVVVGEVGLAVVNPAALSSRDIGLLRDGGVALFPAFTVGVVPIFTLPALLSAYAATDAGKLLPSLYPLRLDIETTTAIFIGLITTWSDSRLLALNPQLTAWFDAVPSAVGTPMPVVVGASSYADSIVGAKLLFQHMRHSDTAAANSWAFVAPSTDNGPNSNPFRPVLAAMGGNMTLIDVESRLSIKIASMPGAVSYRLVSEVTDTKKEFQFVQRLGNGVDETVVPDVSALGNCGAHALNTNMELQDSLDELASVQAQREWSYVGRDSGCWPLSTLLSIGAKLHYRSDSAAGTACTAGLHALEFINYIQSTSILTAPAASLGLVRVAQAPLVSKLTGDFLHDARCDGESMIVILPRYYSITGAVSSFGQAMGVLGILLCAVSLCLVFAFRHKVVIRSSSVPFLMAILCGMALLFASLLPWSLRPSKATCSSFLWLANFGFMLMFAPLYAKTFRIWRIFSGTRLQVMKISNAKLGLATALVLAIEVLILALWQGLAPLQPIEYSRLQDGSAHYFTHCSVHTSGAGMAFVILIGVSKCGLLLFGAMMAFSTRNVKSTFNESASITWTIYNTCMSAAIAIAIIVFIQAVEDTLVILVILLICWIACSAWGLLFVPKFHLLFASEESVIEASRSDLPQEKSNGFSFASVAIMTAIQLKQYYHALKIQVNKSEQALGISKTVWGKASEAAGSVLTFENGKSYRGGSNAGNSKGDRDDLSGIHSGETNGRVTSKDMDGARERGLLSQVGATGGSTGVAGEGVTQRTNGWTPLQSSPPTPSRTAVTATSPAARRVINISTHGHHHVARKESHSPNQSEPDSPSVGAHHGGHKPTPSANPVLFRAALATSPAHSAVSSTLTQSGIAMDMASPPTSHAAAAASGSSSFDAPGFVAYGTMAPMETAAAEVAAAALLPAKAAAASDATGNSSTSPSSAGSAATVRPSSATAPVVGPLAVSSAPKPSSRAQPASATNPDIRERATSDKQN